MDMMSTTIADQVFAKVTALIDAEPGLTRAHAIRRLAGEMGRSVPATSSAFYGGARRARERGAGAATSAPAQRRIRTSGNAGAPRLYAEMLPLVEAGATIEQAARRFGDEDDVEEIAAGFARWMERDQPPTRARAGAVVDAEARITSLEAENRALRRDLVRARQAVERARAILDTASDLP